MTRLASIIGPLAVIIVAVLAWHGHRNYESGRVEVVREAGYWAAVKSCYESRGGALCNQIKRGDE